jgi:hypothetical protein
VLSPEHGSSSAHGLLKALATVAARAGSEGKKRGKRD